MTKKVEENIAKIKTKIKLLFEDELSKEYATKIILFFLDKKNAKKNDEGGYWDILPGGFCFREQEVVGYKSKVIKKLRELEILNKLDSREFYLNIEAPISVKEAEKLGIKTYSDNKNEIYTFLTYFDEPAKFSRKLLERIEQAIETESQIKNNHKGNRYICSVCEYKWESKKKFGEPAKCAKCNSKNIISFEKLRNQLKK